MPKNRIQKIYKEPTFKVDFGSGPNKKEGFIGVDIIKFPGVDLVLDIGKSKFPWKDNSISEAHSSHFVEHLDAKERIHFVNELYRVLVSEASCVIVVPHWCSQRAYGDPTHKWPPVSEFWFYYLRKEWRESNAPHTDIKNWDGGYNCNFEVTWGYNLNPNILTRNVEFQQNALANYKESASDIIANLKKL